MPAENLLVVNVLPENDPVAQEAIQSLQHIAMNIQVIHAYEQSFRPCVGCNACWLVTPGVCAIKDGYNLFGKHISRFFMGQIAKKLGCKEKLDARPLAE